MACTAFPLGKWLMDALVLFRRRQAVMACEAGIREGFRHKEGLVCRVRIVAGCALALRHGGMRTLGHRVTGGTEFSDRGGESGGELTRVSDVALCAFPLGKRRVLVGCLYGGSQSEVTTGTDEHPLTPKYRGPLGAV